MDAATIREQVERLGPWHHAVDLPHGLSTQIGEPRRPLDRLRLPDLVSHAWPHLDFRGKRVVDVACNCGGFSIEAARSGAEEVVGIDPTPHYIRQARFLLRALGISNVEFRRMTIEALNPDRVGSFEIALCFGLLYHLENPVAAMRRLASVTTETMVVETALFQGSDEAAWRMDVLDPVARDDRVASTGLWRTERICQLFPTARAVEELLEFVGFSKVERLVPPEHVWDAFHNGKRAVYLARR